MTNFIGSNIGHYAVVEELGEGGMATVFKAFDSHLSRFVAVKIIRPDREINDKYQLRFEREAKALARLTHPNIVGIIDYGQQEDLSYLVMEFLPSGTLKNRMGSPIPWGEAARMLVPVAHALQFAHENHIIHRDVKPSNILLTASGEPMLTDFGIAKLLEEDQTMELTAAGTNVGTPEYMAPEQLLGDSYDHRADIYALGVVYYEMVTGHKPFSAKTPGGVVAMQATQPLPSPRRYIPTLPDFVERVISLALAKDPLRRYQHMTDLGNALDALSRGERPAAPVIDAKTPPSVPTRNCPICNKPHPATSRFCPNTGKPLPTIRSKSPVNDHTVSHRLPERKQVVKPGKRSLKLPPWLFILIGAGVLVIAASIILPLLLKNRPSEPAGGTTQTSSDGMVQLYIPSCSFGMGEEVIDANDMDDEMPLHTVTLSGYWLDRQEVTVAMFAGFVSSTGYVTDAGNNGAGRILNSQFGTLDVVPGASWQHPTGPSSQAVDSDPVVQVSWDDARAYCEWAGGSLPTEAQWEKAGASEYDLLNMVDDTWEWTADWYGADYYSSSPLTDPQGPTSGTERAVRGSAFSGQNGMTNRMPVDPENGNDRIGFRCVRPAIP